MTWIDTKGEPCKFNFLFLAPGHAISLSILLNFLGDLEWNLYYLSSGSLGGMESLWFSLRHWYWSVSERAFDRGFEGASN